MSGYTGQIPDIAARPLDWQAGAACRIAPDAFFDASREAEAKQICDACPVLKDCLVWVLDRERGKSEPARDDGVIAGLSVKERVALDPTAPQVTDDAVKKSAAAPAADLSDRKHGRRATYKAGCRCDECADANRAYSQDYSKRKKNGAPVRRGGAQVPATPCPSGAAYRRHVKNKEPIDAACRKAYAKERSEHRRKERAAKVYALWAKGLSDPEIAEQLDIGVRAVRTARDGLGLLPNLHVRAAS